MQLTLVDIVHCPVIVRLVYLCLCLYVLHACCDHECFVALWLTLCDGGHICAVIVDN